LPGLRGNPERNYVVTAVEKTFLGTFEPYTASVIAHWQEHTPEKLSALAQDLTALELTWKVEARRLDDTRVELLVGRLKKPKQGGARDLVSIADVGFGVSQTLPLLVALRAADAGQIVYVEQPEIHLHPRAQVKLAEILSEAAMRGVQVVIETHSALLLLAVQTLVAQSRVSPSLVKLHWFTRDERGDTRIDSADLDENGAFGDWAEDFGAVELEAQTRYLDAVERRSMTDG
jgi:predicted ATPase